MALSGVPGRGQPGSFQPGAAGQEVVFAASATTTSSGSIEFTIPGIFAATGTVSSSGSITLSRNFSITFEGTSTSSGSVSFITVYRFATPLEVDSHMSATVREASPTTPDPQTLLVTLDGSAGARQYGLLGVEHGIEPGQGVEVLRADLILTLAEDMPTGSYTFTVETVGESWDAATITWASQPDVSGSATAADSGRAAGDEITINITPLVTQAVATEAAAGTEWYGLRVSVSGSEEIVLYGAFSTAYQPKIRSEVSRPPVAPFNLQPSELAVSETKPELRWDFRDLDAEDVLSEIYVQVDTSDDFETPLYDSGWVASTIPRFDLASPPSGAPATPTLSTGTTYYWQARHRDNHGVESEFSTVTSFTVVTKGTLTADPVPEVPTPTFSWSLTGATQVAYYLAVEESIGGIWTTVWESPWQLSTAEEVTLPDDYVLQEGRNYRRVLRVTDNVERADLPGDRAYYEDIEQFQVAAVVMA
jgi:hypothetical protein